MVSEFYESLARRYGLDEWRGRSRLEENFFVWRLSLPQDQFAGFVPHRMQHVEVPLWPRMIQSLWRRPGSATEETLLHVDAFECTSREAAHDLLVRLLGDVESPLVARNEAMAVGDVVFAGPGGAALLFARGNVAFVLRSAGRRTLPVIGLAEQLDADLVRKPKPPAGAAVSAVRRLEPEASRPEAGLVGMRLEVDERPDKPLTYKFFSRSGEVIREDDRLLYRQLSPGPQEVHVYAAAADQAHSGEAAVTFDLS